MSLMRIREFARKFDFSEDHCRRQVRLGKWPCVRFGPKSIRLDPDKILRLANVGIGQTKRGDDE